MPKPAKQDAMARKYTAIFWVGTACNAIFPVLEFVFWMLLLYDFYSNPHKFNQSFNIAYIVAKSLTEVAWIVSGALLIWSVNHIRAVISARR